MNTYPLTEDDDGNGNTQQGSDPFDAQDGGTQDELTNDEENYSALLKALATIFALVILVLVIAFMAKMCCRQRQSGTTTPSTDNSRNEQLEVVTRPSRRMPKAPLSGTTTY